MKSILTLGTAITMALAVAGYAQAQPVGGAKPATAATKTANDAVLKELPFGDKSDFDDAQRGFIAKPDATIRMNKATLDAIQLKEVTLEQAITKGDLKIEGKRDAFAEFMALLDTFPFWFNIVTP